MGPITIKDKLIILNKTIILLTTYLYNSFFTQKNPHISSKLSIFPLQEANRDVQTKLYVQMFEVISVTARHASSAKVKYSYVTTSIIAIFKPHSFEYQ